MSTIRHRIPSQFVEHSFSKDDQNMKKGVNDTKNDDYEERIVSAKIDDVNSFDQYHDIIAEFEATLNEFGSKFGNLKQKLASRKLFARSKFQSSDLQKTKSHGKSDKIPEREFSIAKSPLTELFEIPHIETLHNIFLVGLILILISNTISDSIETGKIRLGFETIIYSFADLPRALSLWACMKISTPIVFFGFRRWAARYQQKNKQDTFISRLQNIKYPLALVAYFGLFLIIPLRAMLFMKFSIPLNFALLMEQIRMMMKVYAFVISSVSNVKSGKPAPDVSKFIYFLFAPTLVYRDNYPRKSTIDWTSVIWNTFEVLLLIIYIAFLFDRMLMPLYKNFGIEPFNINHLYLKIFQAMLPSTLLFVFGFYLLLHSWMNAWAEALRFGDRTFYKDWWTVPSYHHFYRTWNTVVHDWIHTYVYKEVYENYLRSKPVAFVATIIASAIVHEYIMAFGLGFFYPVLFIFFGFVSILFVFLGRGLSRKAGNVFFWFTLCTGNGLIVSLYLIEAYARRNCPPLTNKTLDLFVPRSWTTCY